MPRDLRRENAALRTRLRDTQTRLHLLASAVLADTDAATSLARLLLSDTLNSDGVSQEPPPAQTPREPGAGAKPRTERLPS